MCNGKDGHQHNSFVTSVFESCVVCVSSDGL